MKRYYPKMSVLRSGNIRNFLEFRHTYMPDDCSIE